MENKECATGFQVQWWVKTSDIDVREGGILSKNSSTTTIKVDGSTFTEEYIVKVVYF